jgi:hypothetical protein
MSFFRGAHAPPRVTVGALADWLSSLYTNEVEVKAALPYELFYPHFQGVGLGDKEPAIF